jgi:hypothetical protein
MMFAPLARSQIWNGQNGDVVFFQNEMPYDPPSQSAWMATPATNGYAAFNQGVPIFATQAFQSPTSPGVQFHDIFTIFLDATHGSGGISSVINGVGGSSTAANPDVPVAVANYP